MSERDFFMRNSSGQFINGHTPTLKGKRNLKMQNEKHPRWKGADAGYSTVHQWVYRKLGKATFCSDNPSHKEPFEWANISGKYLRDLSDYKQLCRDCHRLFDMRKNREKRMALTNG